MSNNYKVINTQNIESLETAVEQYLEKGFVPHGPLQAFPQKGQTTYIQVMVTAKLEQYIKYIQTPDQEIKILPHVAESPR